MVFGVDDAVVVQVGVLQTAHTGTRLAGSVHFRLVLVESFYDVAHTRAVRLFGFHEVLGRGVLVGTGGGFRQVGHLAAEEVKVSLDVVVHSAQVVPVAKGVFHAPVLEAGSVYP